jgi:hypothetical protein
MRKYFGKCHFSENARELNIKPHFRYLPLKQPTPNTSQSGAGGSPPVVVELWQEYRV